MVVSTPVGSRLKTVANGVPRRLLESVAPKTSQDINPKDCLYEVLFLSKEGDGTQCLQFKGPVDEQPFSDFRGLYDLGRRRLVSSMSLNRELDPLHRKLYPRGVPFLGSLSKLLCVVDLLCKLRTHYYRKILPFTSSVRNKDRRCNSDRTFLTHALRDNSSLVDVESVPRPLPIRCHSHLNVERTLTKGRF